ncbi:MAG: tetratricopeptide repeat protein [Microcoleaceae cyanobacterium]
MEYFVNLESVNFLVNNANTFKLKGQLEQAIESYKQALSLQANDPEIYHKLAQVYVLKGSFDTAIACCQDALKINPNLAPAYLTMGNAFQFKNELNSAINTYKCALEIQPKSAEALANLASVYYQLSQIESARKHYQKALEINPNLPSVYFMLGNVWTEEGQLQDAIACYEKSLMLKPNDGRVHFKLALVLAKLERIEEAIISAQRALQLEPNDAEIAKNLKQLRVFKTEKKTRESDIISQEYGLQPEQLHLQKVFDEGKLNIKFTSDNLESLPPITPFNFVTEEQQATVESVVEEYRKNAEYSLKQGNTQDAIVACQQALKLKPDFVMAYMILGNAFYNQGKIESALRAYSQALEIQPNFAEIQANLGSMYFKLGQLDTAIQYYQKALELNPKLAGAYWNLGKVYQQQGKREEALFYFQKTTELNSQFGDANFHFTLGNNLFSQGKPEEAISSYERAIALNPNWAEAHANLGSAKSNLGKWEDAMNYFKRALALKPELRTLHFNLGNSLLVQTRYSEAITHYQEALKVNPEWADAYANLGNALSMTGELQEAIEHYQKALNIKPDWAEVHCRIGHIQKHDQPGDAIINFEKAIQLKPDFSEAYQQLSDLLSHSSNLAGARKVADQYCQNCGDKHPILTATSYVFSYLQSGLTQEALAKLIEVEKYCYSNLKNLEVFELKLLYEIFIFAISHLRDDLEGNAKFYHFLAQEYYERAVPKREINLVPKSSYTRDRELRIGFLSKHFRRHSVGWCSEALIKELSNLTPYLNLYVTGKINTDEVTARFQQIAGKMYWPEKYPNGFADAGEILSEICKDNLDILIDLDSMTVPTNVDILYQHPATICVSWLGFDAPYMSDKNYFLCDQWTHPQGREKHYLEQLIRLPHGSVALEPLKSRPVDRNAVRQNLGIGLDQMTYLCVAPGRKTNPEMLRAQIKILKEVPDSVLIRKGQGDAIVIKETYLKECEFQGVDPNRIKFLGQTKTEEEHRGIYYVADVMLDSYPYNGGTHNLEALSANLPVVTLVGNQYLSRMGYAFLNSVNLELGIAWNWEEYTEWGIKLGQNFALRNSIRQHLIQGQQPESLAPLWNPKQLAKDMYRVFQELLIKAV